MRFGFDWPSGLRKRSLKMWTDDDGRQSMGIRLLIILCQLTKFEAPSCYCF